MNLQKVLLGALLIKPYLASGMQGAFWTRWKPAPATQSSKRSSWNA